MTRLNSTITRWQTPLKKLLPLLLGVLASVAVFFLGYQLTIKENLYINQLIQQEADAIQLELSQEFSSRVLILQQMAHRWEASGGKTQELWETDAVSFMNSFYGYQAIQWVDPDFIARWVVPRAGNEAAQNFDFSQTRRSQITFRLARDLKQVILTRNILLPQGDQGVLAIVPLFVGENFEGFIVGVFQFQTLFDSILRVPPGYKVAIYDRDQLIYHQSGVPQDYSDHQTVFVRAYGADWRVKVFPTLALISEIKSPLPLIVLVGGLVLVWLFVLVVHLAEVSHHQVYQLKKTNRQLQREIYQRKQAELGKKRLAGIVECSEDAIISKNLDDIITSWNAAAEKIFGYTAQEILGKSGKQLILPNYQQEEQDILEKIKQGERIEHYDTKRLKKDGSLIDVSISVSPIKDEVGNIIGASKIARNIAERKQAEEALRQSETRYRQLIHNLNAGFVIHDPDTRILLCNLKACELFKLSMDQMMGKTAIDPAWNFVREDESLMPIEEYPVNRILSTKTPLRNYVLGIKNDTSPLTWVLINAYAEFEASGEVKQVIITFIDITKRKQAEEEIKHTRNFLQALLDHLPVAVFVKDAHPQNFGVFQFWNKTCEQLFGISAEQAIGKTDYDFFPTEQANLFKQTDKIAVKQGKTEDLLEELVGSESGGRRWLHTVKVPVYTDKKPDYLLCFSEDITERKKAESERQEMAEVMENALSGIAKLDTQGRYLYVNKTYANIGGYQPQEMIGMSWQETVHPEQVERLIGAYQEMIKQGRVEVETTGIRQDGSIFYKQIVLIATYDEQHQLQGHYCFMKDITDRKQAEISLEQELLRTTTLFNTSMDGIVVMNNQGDVVQASPSFARMLGYTLEETLSLNLADWDAQWTKEELKLMLNREEIIPLFETKHRRKDASEYDVEISWTRVELDGEMMNFCICRDISDRQQTLEALRYQKEIFQTIVNHIPVMITLFDSEGQIQLINPELERVLEYPLESWQEQDILSQCYPDPAYCQSILEFMLAATGKWQDMTTITATGKAVETSWANVRLSSGYSLGIGQDISDRKQKELALRQAMEAAEAANLAKSIFLANMSHELRTPLNVILGFTQVMAHDPALTPTQQKDLQTIQRSGDHLLSLINDVLDLSKIESGHSTLEETGFDLMALLDSLRNMLAERASSKGLELCFEIAPEVPQFIVADAQKLRQILLNLLSNAIKFTPQGSVTLRVRNQEFQKLHTLIFEVTDTGIGMAPEELETIFDAFVQAEAGKRSVSGTGLGLTISRKLLELMGGKIRVRSTIGKGSTFTFTLPVRLTNGVDITQEQSNRLVIGLACDHTHHRILVVDDRAENRLLIVRLVTQIGLEVREAGNGQEAVQLCKEWLPDLIWMDIRMPVLDGYEATKQIRAMEQGQNSVIIALTAQASNSDRTLALAAGCNDYISKPFHEQTLFQKMAEYLGLEYVYQESEKGVSLVGESLESDSNSKLDLNPGVLGRLSDIHLAHLEDAAICGNDLAITEFVDQFLDELAPLGTHLKELASQYQFEQILNLIHSVQSSNYSTTHSRKLSAKNSQDSNLI